MSGTLNSPMLQGSGMPLASPDVLSPVADKPDATPEQMIEALTMQVDLMNRNMNRMIKTMNGIEIDRDGSMEARSYGDTTMLRATLVSGSGDDINMKKYAWGWEIYQKDGATAAFVRVYKAYVEHHMFDPQGSFTDKFWPASDDVTDAADSDVKYEDFDISADNYTVIYVDYEFNVTADMSTNNDTTEIAALEGVTSTETNLKKPILCVHYDTATDTLKFVRHYCFGRNLDLNPVFGG